MSDPTTALVVVPDFPVPDAKALATVRTRLELWRGKAKQTRKIAEEHRIESDADAIVATQSAKDLTGLLNEIDDRRNATTEPFRLFVAAVNAIVKPIFEDLDAAKSAYKLGLTRHQRRKEAEAEAISLRAIEERQGLDRLANQQFDSGHHVESLGTLQRAEDVGLEGAAAARIAAGPIRSESGATSSLRRTWKWRLVNESEVSRAFMTVNYQKINALRFEKPRPPEIAGGVWEQEVDAVVR